MSDNKYNDSDSDDDYHEVVVNGNDYREEIYEFDTHRNLNIIHCIGQIKTEFDYEIENDYKTSLAGTGTAYKTVNGVVFVLSCAHNIRHKIYNCPNCTIYNRTKACTKCGEILNKNNKKLVKPTYIEFKRRKTTPNNFGLVEHSYECHELYVPDGYEQNTVLTRGFDFAILMFRDDGYYSQLCRNITLDIGRKILKNYKRFNMFGYPGCDFGNAKKNKLFGYAMKSDTKEKGFELIQCEKPRGNFTVKSKYILRQRYIDASAGQSGSAIFVTVNENIAIVFGVHVGGHQKRKENKNDYSYNVVTLLNEEYINVLEKMTDLYRQNLKMNDLKKENELLNTETVRLQKELALMAKRTKILETELIVLKQEKQKEESLEIKDECKSNQTKINHDIEWNLFDISNHDNMEKSKKQQQKINNNKKEVKVMKDNNDDHDKKTWTESLGSMLTHAKHNMYTMIANPSFKWSTRNNRHLFTFYDDVWIIGKCYKFDGINNKSIMQSIVLDIYSKIWITYRSKFEEILSSSYNSDAGWGCMLRTTQMMTAQALIILYFDYGWNLTKLITSESSNIYYNILSLFNDSHNSVAYPLSIHNMLSYGNVLYNKPVGDWYGPTQSCIMIKKCIENNIELNNKIEVIVSDSQIIYKSDISLTKYTLIFLPLRLGLDSLNINYIKSIKQCFHLKECIGIIGGKPQKSLYFIGYQENNLFYLDPHTILPAPNINKLLSKQKCVFHCEEIFSLSAKQLDPSMTVTFLIKPNKKCLNSFWKNAKKLMNRQYSIFSLAQQRPNDGKRTGDRLEQDKSTNNNNNNISDDDDCGFVLINKEDCYF